MKRRHRHISAFVWVFAACAAGAMGAVNSSAATHYVSQTSPNPTPPYSTLDTAAHTIQEAVDVASDGDTVSVQAGDYGLTNQVTVTKGILLQGASGASQTFLTGLSNIWCLGISNSLAVVDGFTLRDPYPFDIPRPNGAFLVGGTIQNCAFTNFYIDPEGGAIVMSGGIVSNSVVTYRRYPISYGAAAVSCTDEGLVTDSQILGIESSGYGSAVSLANSRLENSVVSGVSRFGPNSGGVAVSALSSSVVGCTISNNSNITTGGGVHLEDSLMDRCVVTHNLGGGECSGGGGIFEVNSVIRNSLITSNSLTFIAAEPSCGNYGGGVYMRGGSLVNCTVVGNSADVISNGTGGGGGVYAESGGVTNCVIYFNLVYVDNNPSSNWLSTGTAIFDHCCTTPTAGGAGNVTQDPQFVDMAHGNFHLASTSPCIGAGVVQLWMAGAQDLDGNPRTTNGRVDMGAYQSGYPPPSTKLSIFRSGSNVILQWPSAGPTDIVLEKSSDLTSSASWTQVVAPVTDDGTNRFVTIPATNSVQFFRRR